MNHIVSVRSRLSGIAASIIIYAAFSNMAMTNQPTPAVDSPVDPAKSRLILESAGASAGALSRFDGEWTRLWPEDAAYYEAYLKRQSPEGLLEFIKQLSTPTPDDQYVPGAEAQVKAGVPKGEIFQFSLGHSNIFPGTNRRIRVYVPAEYTANTPACVYVGLDDLFFSAPTIFDNLIHKREIPVLIAIGVRPGVVDSSSPTLNPRFNRSLEFDALNGDLARFLLEEVFPAVEHHKTHSGLPIILSRTSNDRAIGGVSTGGIAAFTVAWQRPDEFRRVFTGIGTFVGMRGGDSYPVIVRKTEPKPIRIFMQDGANDQLTEILGEVGDWWLGNQTMRSALEFAGYQVEHIWGEGTHDTAHAVAVFPDAMRWLWKDWPQAIVAGQSKNTFMKSILLPGQGWQAVPGSYRSAEAMAADPSGVVAFWDAIRQMTFRISEKDLIGATSFPAVPYKDMAFDSDGRAYVTEAQSGNIVAFTSDGDSSTIAEGIWGSNLVVTHRGSIYITADGRGGEHTGKLWLLHADGRKLQLDGALSHPTGVALSPDNLWLAVAEGRSHCGYSYRILPDGTLRDRQKFYWSHVSDDVDDSGVKAWIMDHAGRLYAATRMGVQIFDRNGRVRAILPVPGGEVTALAFGGPRFDILYVASADHRIYRRKLGALGAPPWKPPITLPLGEPG